MKNAARVPASAGVRSLALAPTTGATSPGLNASQGGRAPYSHMLTSEKPIGDVSVASPHVGAEP